MEITVQLFFNEVIRERRNRLIGSEKFSTDGEIKLEAFKCDSKIQQVYGINI